MSRIKVFAGHFGSGKTELAINYAKNLASEGNKVTLVDIDIVNPYFCIRDLKKELEEDDIRIISANPHFSNAELMVVPAEVNSAFNDKSSQVVIDVGGDDSGAVVLGQYNRYFGEEEYEMYFVINNNRPFTSSLQETEEYIRAIEKASRLKVTHLISNTNLSYETSIEDILKGDRIVAELSQKLGLPYKYIVCRKDLLDSIKGRVQAEIYGIDIYMKPPWNRV
jgi:hypothetical protein